MLKFKNRNCVTGKEVICKVSMESVQGGVEVQMEIEYDEGNEVTGDTILLTPMDAACFVSETCKTKGTACMPVGHSTTGTGCALAVSKILAECDWMCVGSPAEAYLYAGDVVKMVVPSFVVISMASAIVGMMGSLMYPSTGDMEEDFG